MGGFAGYYGQTLLHPIALAYVALLGVAALSLPRRWALLPLFLAATTAPIAQRVVIAGADFTLLRLLLLAYLLRIVFRSEIKDVAWNRQDALVLFWTIAGTTMMTIQYGGDPAALINRTGWSYDILLTFGAARVLLRTPDDLLAFCRGAAIISLPMAVLFLLEWSTGRNLFSVFGGVREYTQVREGRLRCQGPFAHPILAGTFWSAALPLIWSLRYQGRLDRLLMLAGTGAAIIVIIACASSTPLMATMAAMVGLALYTLRAWRTAIWIGLIFALCVLHFLVMDRPVWHLLARADVIGGSTGWHRFVIFDEFVRNFGDWWLTGFSSPTDWRWQLRDITNQYMIEGLRGGLLTLIIFVSVLIAGFGNVGRALNKMEMSGPAMAAMNPENIWLIWLAGVGLFVHVVAFWAVSYFAQMVTLFYIQLAVVAAVPGYALAHGAIQSSEEQDFQRPGRVKPEGGLSTNSKGLLGQALANRTVAAGV